MKKRLIQALSLMLLIACQNESMPEQSLLDSMSITVTELENRPISFTNKEAAYYYTQSHENNHPEHQYFVGMNIAQSRIFQGYELFDGNEQLDNKASIVTVFPYKFVRRFKTNVKEEFWLFDYKNAIEVNLENLISEAGIRLKGDGVKLMSLEKNAAYFSSIEGNKVIALTTLNGNIENRNGTIYSSGKVFIIAVDDNMQKAFDLLNDITANREKYKTERCKRLTDLLENNVRLKAQDDSLTLAMNWINITMDQLVTRQNGDGIYAGLPWFNEYWGRDEFIALPGACLVTGRFNTARAILKSFAEYQNTDPDSKYFGRLPNIVKPQSINYHTTDGTPRFIIQLKEYVKYSGDTSIIRELYPNVKYSIEGALKNWTDKNGYLLHEDNETWMDARRNFDKKSYSPRSTRANDIQALWYEQLVAGVYFAEFVDDSESFNKWKGISEKVKQNFEKDFTSQTYGYVADRLDEKDKAEYKLRPNQLFTFEMIENKSLIWKATRKCWEELVYPWGVASLNRQDEFFHPYHLRWENYHKDEAYHNGTVWLWLNGIAMQRMIEANQQEYAFQLFKNMNLQALTKGVVGGLGENMDAYPLENKQWPKLTGTYLQAWSNSEHLRVWYQYFLGIRPDAINKTLTLAPRIPEEIKDLSYNSIIGSGSISAIYKKGDVTTYSYEFDGIDALTSIDIFPFEKVDMQMTSGQTIEIAENNTSLVITLVENGKLLKQLTLSKSEERVREQRLLKELFKETQFCKPLDINKHDVLKKKFDGDRGV